MEKSTAIIDAQTSLLRELRETYVVLYGDGSSDETYDATVAILHSIEKLALATTSPVPPIATQQIEPPAAEICKVTHDVVNIRNERNGQPGWENHAASVCGISPEKAIEVWDAAVAKSSSDTATGRNRPWRKIQIAEANAKPKFAEAKTAKPNLAIGQTWRTRSGEVGVIERKSVGRFFCRFGSDSVRSYDARGYYASGVSELDLTELISDGDGPPTE